MTFHESIHPSFDVFARAAVAMQRVVMNDSAASVRVLVSVLPALMVLVVVEVLMVLVVIIGDMPGV